MADVFLSYKAEDRPRIAHLAQALEQSGYDVWWDAHIGGGEEWRERIQEQLESARCVVVAWSKRSVGPDGRFVRDEATRAQRRGVYLPVLLDKVDPPLGFGETQALPLIGWRGDPQHRRFKQLEEAVGATIEGRRAKSRPVNPDSGIDRRLLIGGGVIAVGALATGTAFWMRSSSVGGDSIAVLPFANLSADPAQAYFSDGIAEELRSALARIPGLQVVGRTSSEAVRDQDARTAAKKLAIGNVLIGSVRRAPGILRVASQLVGADGIERWSDTYDRPEGNALIIQSDIAEQVAVALSIRLGNRDRQALRAGGTSNAVAYDHYLNAISITRTDDREATFRRAVTMLDQALDLDPRFAEAVAAKARFLNVLTNTFARSKQDLAKGYGEAGVIARRAISLAPNLPAGYVALAEALSGKLDLGGASEQFARAAVLAPNDAAMLRARADLLSQWGKGSQALALADQAIAADPLDPGAYVVKCSALYLGRRFADAVQIARKLLRMAPNRGQARFNLGASLMFLGRLPEAAQAFSGLGKEDPFGMTGRAILAWRAGRHQESDEAFQSLRAAYGDSASYQYAEILAQRGDEPGALAALKEAFAALDPGLVALASDPLLDPVRKQAEFPALLRKLNVPA